MYILKMYSFITFVLVLCICVSKSSQVNILQEAANLGATDFVKIIMETGMQKILAGTGPFTLFVPTNEAVSKLPKLYITLKELVQYHVIMGEVLSKQLKNEELIPTLLNPNGTALDIRFNLYKGNKLLTAEGSSVIVPDKTADNGVVHVVDRVLYPVPLTNLPVLIAMLKSTSTMMSALSVVDLVDFLLGGPFTLFAPTNDAFLKLPPDEFNKLLANHTALTAVLKYHILNTTVWSVGMMNNEALPTVLYPRWLGVTEYNGKIFINNGLITDRDLAVSNGVVHLIDHVLLPNPF
ncbi:hypothetical protein ACJMK2_018607 [Sinanodonta woodiana]|uniref:FAS1 domain-containing protein n=1 Tax=Sinanodonta woodiana TaxID=1069815 RepID=A0ABD3UFK2_SINWO